MLLDTRNYGVFGLGMGISIVFEIFNNFPFLGGGVDPRSNNYCIAYITCHTGK
jgi:hypothetical protein